VLIGLRAYDATIEADGVTAAPGRIEPERIVAALVAGGVGVREFTVRAPSLEDLFVSLTGEGFDVSG
jgi:ABC-2 type transport system ATP-binding protein